MVDVHTHVVPRDLPFGGGTAGAPHVVSSDGEHVVHVQGRPFRRITPLAWDIAKRVELMDHQGVAVQVLSPMPDLLGYWDEAAPAAELCAGFNRWIAAAVASAPDRFRGLGTVPMQDPELAIDELASIAELGLAGVEIGSNIEGTVLHDPRFRPVFAEAARLELIVFIHAYRPPSRTTFSQPLDANACTFPNDVGLALSGLLVEGVLGADPASRWVFSHGGGSAVTNIPRLAYLREASDGVPAFEVQAAILRQLRNVHVDLLVYSSPLLRLVVETFGIDRVLVGSDQPFLPGAPGALLDEVDDLGAAALDRIRWANAAELFRLPRTQQRHEGARRDR